MDSNEALIEQITVEAQPDHLNSLAKAKPINALAELIWNALDADADEVLVSVQDNAMGSPEKITVKDNGEGLPMNEAVNAFGHLGGSWKKGFSKTKHSNRPLHGRDGKGRFKAFALGSVVSWETTYKDSDQYYGYSIVGSYNNLKSFKIGQPVTSDVSQQTGTTVTIEGIGEPLGALTIDGSALEQLSEHFAIYLSDIPNIKIKFRGQAVDPALVQKERRIIEIPKFELPGGKIIDAKLEIIEWSIKKKERKLCLCDERGFTLHEIEAGVRPGSEFNFTAYLRSNYIGELHHDNRLLLEELDTDLSKLVGHVRDHLRAYFRERKAANVADLVDQWKSEGIYPFEGEANDPLDRARREVFDICALNIHEYLDGFRQGGTKDRKFLLRMLKTALDENPEALKRILNEVLDLPKEKQNDLADLLDHTTLSALIEAGKLVADRLSFLAGLQELLFDPESKKSLQERSQLHKILENETWIFGEEYFLTNSDESLTTVLRNHLEKLRPNEAKKRAKQKVDPVKRDDGSTGVIDMLLAREVPQYGKNRQEFLVVELKRPSQKIDLEVKSQIESYALAVVKDERFDTRNTHWTFIAVSNEMSDEAAETVDQVDKPVGYFMVKDKYKIGLVTWSEIIQASRTRLEMLQTKLGYVANKDEGVRYLHAKYYNYLPDCLKADATS